MRILYIDVDSLRPDHLGCYGYHRDTSPTIDALAEQGARFENCYASDAPCLPSRTALWSGRFGIHNGVVNHGGVAAQPFIEGPERGFADEFFRSGWVPMLRRAGYYTATISPFHDRHAAWHWTAGYREIINPGKRGQERADEVTPLALDWLSRHGAEDNWFLHVNFWDPHTPYRTPPEYGNPFAGDPLPEWLTEAMRQRCWDGFGPHSAQEPHGFGGETHYTNFPRLPGQLDSMDAVRQWIDGYDVGIRYLDDHLARLIEALDQLGVLDDTAIIISADHGENQGELNVWGDHQTADQHTCRVPLVVRWPGLTDTARVDSALHYQLDWGATLLELAGADVPDNWDGQSFADAFRAGEEAGREYLVISQGAWACQRGVRFGDHLLLRTYHDGLKELEPVMLFDLTNDPHEQRDLADDEPELVRQALSYLADWQGEMALSATHNTDPLWTVLREGGPFHTRAEVARYVARLRETGRGHHADRLLARHGKAGE